MLNFYKAFLAGLIPSNNPKYIISFFQVPEKEDAEFRGEGDGDEGDDGGKCDGKKGKLWEKKGNVLGKKGTLWGCNFLKWPRHIWRNCALLQLLYEIILPRFRQNWRISTCRTRSSGFWGFTATFTFSSRPPRPPPPSSDPTCSSLARYLVIGHFVFILSTTLDIADFYYTCPGSQLYCFHVRQLCNIRFDSGGQWTWENKNLLWLDDRSGGLHWKPPILVHRHLELDPCQFPQTGVRSW